MKKSIIFMFPGLGAQYFHMGKELYKTDKFFKNSLDEINSKIKNYLKEKQIVHQKLPVNYTFHSHISYLIK